MRQSIILVGSIIVLGALPSACGTKGPLTLSPALPPKTPAAAPAQPATAPVADANTATGQR